MRTWCRMYAALRCSMKARLEAVGDALRERPERRDAQRTLAREVTRLVHGADAVDAAERITTALFDGQVRALREDDFSQLARDGMAASSVAPGTGLLDAMTAAGLAPSNAAARRLVQSRGVRVNGDVVEDAGMRLEASKRLARSLPRRAPRPEELAHGGRRRLSGPEKRQKGVDRPDAGRKIRPPCPYGPRVRAGALFKRLKTSHSCGRSMLSHEQTFWLLQPRCRAAR